MDDHSCFHQLPWSNPEFVFYHVHFFRAHIPVHTYTLSSIENESKKIRPGTVVEPWPPGLGIDPACLEISFPRGLDPTFCGNFQHWACPFFFFKPFLFLYRGQIGKYKKENEHFVGTQQEHYISTGAGKQVLYTDL